MFSKVAFWIRTGYIVNYDVYAGDENRNLHNIYTGAELHSAEGAMIPQFFFNFLYIYLCTFLNYIYILFILSLYYEKL